MFHISPGLLRGQEGSDTAWEAAGCVLWLGRGWRNVLVLSKCLSPSGTWPEPPSPSLLSYLSNSWGLWAEMGPPSTWPDIPQRACMDYLLLLQVSCARQR